MTQRKLEQIQESLTGTPNLPRARPSSSGGTHHWAALPGPALRSVGGERTAAAGVKADMLQRNAGGEGEGLGWGQGWLPVRLLRKHLSRGRRNGG